MHIAYVATGNYPSRFAHSIQIMKNAQAWANISDQFEFYSNFSLIKWLKRDAISLEDKYGLKKRFTKIFYPLYFFEKHNIPILNHLYYTLVAKKCREENVDLIYTRTYVMARYAIQQNIPVIVETHGPPDAGKEKLSLYAQLQYPQFLALVTISEVLKKMYIEYGLPAEKIIVAEDGVDLERFSPELSINEARSKLGLPQDKPIAVYVGHLYKDRGIREILDAARLLPETEFILVGGHDEDIAYWRTQLAGLNNVTIHGFVNNNEVPLWLWAADALLMPYNTICPTAKWMSPLKLFEYMAAQRPIIASKLPALEIVLQHEHNALLVEPDSGIAVSKALLLLQENEKLRFRLATTAQAFVSKFSWDQRVKNILNTC